MVSSDWPTARAALVTVLAAVHGVDRVVVAPPQGAAGLPPGTTTVMLTPPARTTARTPGGRTEVRYTVTATVLRLMASSPETASLEVDSVVESINAAMESHITLGGAVTVAGPFDWSAALAVEYPPNSGVWFVGMSGTMPLTFVRDYMRAA